MHMRSLDQPVICTKYQLTVIVKKDLLCATSCFVQTTFLPPAVWPTPAFVQTAVTVIRFSFATSLQRPEESLKLTFSLKMC